MLIFAAMDTTSNALSRILHMLATHPEEQEKLRQEILDAQQEYGENIPYDELVALPFLDVVCRETLRLYVKGSSRKFLSPLIYLLPHSYPPLSIVSRTYVALLSDQNLLSFPVFRARRDIILPLSTPICGVDGREMQEIMVPKNTNVIVSILGANRDTALWGLDALEWKPERWLDPLPEAVTNARIPGVYSHLYALLRALFRAFTTK
jgi:cytochrome P450